MNSINSYSRPLIRSLILFPLLISIFIISCTLQTARIDETIVVSEKDLLIEKLHSYNNAVKSIEGKALAVYKEDERTYSFRVIVAVDKSSLRFRLDASDFVFKKPLLTLIRNEEDVLAVNYFKKTVSSLQYDDLDFRSLTGLSISKEILEHALLGEVFIIKGSIYRADSEHPSLCIKGGEGTEVVLFNEELLPVQVQYVFAQNSLDIDFSKYEKFEDVSFPLKITINDESRRLIINYSELGINTPIKSASFSLEDERLEGFTYLN